MWVLTICTAAWLLCGALVEVEYHSEEECYRARDALMVRPQDFKYVVCGPKPKGEK